MVDSLNNTKEFVVLNICERIEIRVPVDLSISVTLGFVAFDVAGIAQDSQNFEIGGLPFHLALFCFRKYAHGGSIFFKYCSLCLDISNNISLNKYYIDKCVR